MEVLVVLRGSPCTTPFETVGAEEAVGEIGGGDPVRVVAAGAIGVWATVGGFDSLFAAAGAHEWIIERIEVDRHTEGVARELLRSGDTAIVETRGVIGCHGALIITIIAVNELHSLYGVAGEIELTEDIDQVGGNGTVGHHLTDAHMAVAVVVREDEIAEVGTIHGASGRI